MERRCKNKETTEITYVSWEVAHSLGKFIKNNAISCVTLAFDGYVGGEGELRIQNDDQTSNAEYKQVLAEFCKLFCEM